MADEETTEEYKPHFDRLGVERRVLGTITDEDHVGRGPRNTAERLAQELAEDPFTDLDDDVEAVQGFLDDLEASGLVSKDGDVYEVTEAGQYELTH